LAVGAASLARNETIVLLMGSSGLLEYLLESLVRRRALGHALGFIPSARLGPMAQHHRAIILPSALGGGIGAYGNDMRVHHRAPVSMGRSTSVARQAGTVPRSSQA
jgi:hypothetical protein